ncbi:unnamed protein product [Miscanthus lutarioriparius]|uniref:DUF4220 domain-containing protein n=1 Tax=Miscanthus lutarioriparius TaxID=422564 RepID=A0A811QNI7_9POAL|nr:unnamed protein product [Miscanthus lutarioriparius]
MGFNPPVPQGDSDWEIRVAVLLSLFFQVLLFLVGPTRKRTANPMVRFACWSCYLLADWVADLALGLLLNNLGNIGGNGSSSSSSSSLSSAGVKRGGGGGVGTTTGSGSSSPGIFAFWTPFLLLHLGGQDTIAAYSMEDNELWLRHLIGLLFQLFAACVVFSCSIEANPMIPATVVMLVAGIIKYGERTYSLYSGSVDGILASILPAPDPGPNYARLMNVFSSRKNSGLGVEVVAANGLAHQFQQDQSRHEVSRLRDADKKPEEQAYDLFTIFRSVCYDINLGHRERQTSQAFFLDRDSMKTNDAVQVIELELNFMYDMVHTKEPVAHTKLGCILRLVGSGCIAYSAVAFFHLDKGSIRRVDADITYALLLGALALDAAALSMLIFCSNWTLVFLDKSRSGLLNYLGQCVRPLQPKLARWSERTPQLNLISYCLGKLDGDEASATVAGRHLWRSPRAIRALRKAAHRLGAGAAEIFDDIFFVRRDPLKSRGREDPIPVIDFVFTKLKDAAKQVRQSTVPSDQVGGSKATTKASRKARHKDVEEMRKACSYRGEKALNDTKNRIVEEMKQRIPINWDILFDSVIDRDFDESLLMWHITTDLCLYYDEPPSPRVSRWMSISKTLSEYLLYLLVKQPKILAASAGVGQMAYQDTCAEARRLFESVAMWEPDHEDARRMLLHACTDVDPELVKGGRSRSVLFPACIIAKELRELDIYTRSQLVAGVWMEMLTYAAAKCKGTTHLHQLARGGELITMVWLLMAHMGIGNIYKKMVEEDATPKLIIRHQ